MNASENAAGVPYKLLTQAEVCQRLQISLKTLHNLRNRRQISYLRFGHRLIRFREQAVEDFLRKRMQS
jgi:excisionase family DNA binding protein